MLNPVVRRNGIAVLIDTKIKAGREVEGRNRKHPRSEERRGIFADRSVSRDLNIVKVGEGKQRAVRYHGVPRNSAKQILGDAWRRARYIAEGPGFPRPSGCLA